MVYNPNIDNEFEYSIRGANNSIASARKSPRVNDVIITSNPRGKIANINVEELAKPKKRKLMPFSLKKTAIVAIAIIGLLFSKGCATDKKVDLSIPITVPDGYVEMDVRERVEHGESVYSIAKEYYEPEVYDLAYDNIDQFVDYIIYDNELPSNGKVEAYDTILIPLLIDTDNPLYQELQLIESEINNKNYWVDYTVRAGDSLSTIAAKVSGTDTEREEIMSQIMSVNDLSSPFLYAGETIRIPNPELGPLRTQADEIKIALFESIKVKNTQK